MRSRNLLVLCILLPLAVCAAWPQSPDSGSMGASSKRADVIHLLRMTGASKGSTQSFDLILPWLKQSMPQVPDRVWQEFRSEMREDDMIDITYAIWDKHFTHDEIRELIRFYETPVGQKIIRETPAIQQESVAAGQKWGTHLVDHIMARLHEKGYVIPPDLQKKSD